MHNHVRLQHREDVDKDMEVREGAALFDNNDDAALFNLESDSSKNIDNGELTDTDQPTKAHVGEYDDEDWVEFMLDDIFTPSISKEDFELYPGINILLQETVKMSAYLCM